VKVLQDYLGRRRAWSDYLFCTRTGAPLDTSYVRAMLPRLAKKAGVQRRVHAHIFRHTFAVELAREGVPMPLIQRLLGHASLATTSVYLSSLAPEEALNIVREREEW
jgi:integrase/recombinase XerD